VIVTQSLHVEMWYLRARHVNFSFLRAALTHGAPGHELQPPPPLAPHMSEGGTKLCLTAAIGVMYDGESQHCGNISSVEPSVLSSHCTRCGADSTGATFDRF